MTKPNFFIIGAPKCGTTSLAAWLVEHPDIFMSPVKEPHFFNTDNARFLNSLSAYQQLFENASPRHRAVGEASVWYLSSTDAVGNILSYNPDAKFIVMLRNPVEMAPSLHEELVFTGREDVTDFSAAWKLQDARGHGDRLPRMVGEPKFLQYGDLCRLGAQMERLYKLVPPDRVKVLLLDDLKKDVRSVYRSVLDFLAVDDDGRTDFAVLNRAKSRRWPMLLHLSFAAIQVKKTFGIESGLGLWSRVDALNRSERPRADIDTGMRAKLEAYFADDVRRLQKLIGRDLSQW